MPSHTRRVSYFDAPCAVDRVEAERMRSITHTAINGVSPRSLPSSPYHVVQSQDKKIDPPQANSKVKLSRAIDGLPLGCLAANPIAAGPALPPSNKGRSTHSNSARHSSPSSRSVVWRAAPSHSRTVEVRATAPLPGSPSIPRPQIAPLSV